MRVTLIIPELLWGDPADTALFSRLDGRAAGRLLATRAPARWPAVPGEALATALVGAPASTAALRLAGEPGLAAAARAASGGSSAAGRLLCADPLHLHFHQQLLVASGPGAPALGEDEAVALVSALNAHFAPAAQFLMATADRWYMLLDQPVAGSWPPPSRVAGRSLAPELFAPAKLQRIGSQAQMLLHAHPVNQARETAGRLTANAIWLWGNDGSPLPLPPLPRPTLIVADGPLWRGVAGALGVSLRSPGDGGLAGALAAAGGDDLLIVLDELLAPAVGDDADAYATAWQALAADWLDPLAERLAAAELNELTLLSPCSAYGLLHWPCEPPTRWRRLLARAGLGGADGGLAKLAARLAANPEAPPT
jgi:hypothetical protein